ncbi:MAG: hypothetical protein JJU10_07110 [Idiomarina sp.]|nr:hypothetical protein [Idiomarina sp.]
MLKPADRFGHIDDIVHDRCVPNQCVLCVHPALSEVKVLDALLGCKVTHTSLMLNGSCAVLTYGHGRLARKANAAHLALELPKLYVSPGVVETLTKDKAQMFSMTVDQLGHVYHATSPGYFEELLSITQSQMDADDVQAQVSDLKAQWQSAGISRWNHRYVSPEAMPEDGVIVVLQAPEDPWLDDGAEQSFSDEDVLAFAQTQFPDSPIVTVHHGVSIASWLRKARALVTVSSPLGIEALMHDVPVFTLGMPAYAGRGFTTDQLVPPPGRKESSEAQWLFTYLLQYSRYVHPVSQERVTLTELISYFAEQREALQTAFAEKQAQWEKMPRWLRWLIKQLD